MNPVLRVILGWVTIAAIIFAVATYSLVMVLSVLLVSGTQLGADLAARYTSGLPPLGAFFIYSKVPIPISINLLAYVGFCVLVFAACFIAGFRSRGGFVPSLLKLIRVGRITSSSNWMVVMPLVSSALLVVVILVTILLSVSGVPSGVLCKPGVDCPSTAALFAGLAHAPIGEELAYRILTPLGLIVPIRVAWRRLVVGQGPSKAKFLSIIGISILSPENAKTSTGYPSFSSHGWRGIHWLEWIFITVSSILFGLAHVQSGGGTDWGQGKVVTAAISGAALAFVYVAYGAYANILLHWFFDFYVEVLSLGLPISGGFIYILADLVIFGGLFLIGIFSTVVAVSWLGKRIVERVSPTTYKPPEIGPWSV
jgi:hypothetical protein